MESLVEEVEVLESIYGEDVTIYRKGISYICGTVHQISGSQISLTFRISADDSVWSTDPKMENVERALKTYFEQNRSAPGAIYETLLQFRTFEGAQNTDNSSQCGKTNLQEVRLFRLDHIRDQKRYLSHLEDLTAALGEGSCHLILGQQIFIALSGLPKQVQNFIRGWKTRNVDVDSKGQPCKERMMQEMVKLQNATATANECKVFSYKASGELESYLNEKFGVTTSRALLNAIQGL